jgi:4-hydroxybenzoate polyprenyltransferase
MHPDRCRNRNRCATPEGGNMTNDIAVVDTDEMAEPAPRRRDQRGMVSAEWAVGIIAAIAIAGVLLGIVTSGPVRDALLDFILMVIRSFSGYIQ